jgi:hypothetical protein
LAALLFTGIQNAPLQAEPPAREVLMPLPSLPGAVLITNTAVMNALGTNALGAKIVFATPIYDFGKVKSGDPVKYSYIFTNTGDQVLELSHVQPQCGCTAAGEWTKKVEPGQTGMIPLQFNTASYSGQVLKTITVSSNDKGQPVSVLQLKGTIWKPIEFLPPYTVMNVAPDVPNASAIVRILNNTDDLITLTDPQSSTPAFTVELSTNKPGKEFQLMISSVPPLKPGSISGRVTLKSSLTNQATIDVPFWANVQAAVMVLPPQVMLPGAPLINKMTPSITIQNNTTNSVTVSDATVDLPGVEAVIREMQPGRLYSVQLNFPAGFEIPQGQKGMLSVKSTHPQFASIQVPIVQMARPASPPSVPAVAPVSPQPVVVPRPTVRALPPALPPLPGAPAALAAPAPTPPRLAQ